MILKTSIYVNFESPIQDSEINKEIIDSTLRIFLKEHDKEIEEILSGIFKNQESELQGLQRKGKKIPVKEENQMIFQILTKEQVIEAMRR